MLALALAAALVAPLQTADSGARGVLDGVCLPYVGSGAVDPAALDGLGFALAEEDGDSRQYVTRDQAFILRLTETGTESRGDLDRLCVLQARRGGLESVRRGVAGVLEAGGYTLDPDMPADRPIWSRGGATVSLRQNEGRATIMRVSWSSLGDAS